METVKKNIKIEENRTLEKYFSKNEKEAQAIKDSIHANLLSVIRDRPVKIKTVKGYKYRHRTIFEYKVVLPKDFVCRASFVYEEDTILVFFISNTIRKSEYVRLVAKVPGVEKA